MNFYKRHIGDYLRDTAHLSLLEHGVYTRLLDVYYTRESAIPEEQAARLIGARTRQERDAVDRVLAEFFELVDGAWQQKRCEREIDDATKKAERNREIGKLGGRPRKTETQTVIKTEAETEPRNNPDGFQNEPKQNPSQTPDSRLQTPEEKQRESVSPSGSRLPIGFPSASELDWCKRERPDLNAEALGEKFRDYWSGVPGQKGRKADWPATWRNFVRSEWNRSPPTSTASTPSRQDRISATVAELTGRTRHQSEVIDVVATERTPAD